MKVLRTKNNSSLKKNLLNTVFAVKRENKKEYLFTGLCWNLLELNQKYSPQQPSLI